MVKRKRRDIYLETIGSLIFHLDNLGTRNDLGDQDCGSVNSIGYGGQSYSPHTRYCRNGGILLSEDLPSAKRATRFDTHT